MTRIVRVTYEDGTHEDVNLREAAFGLDGTALHGPVVSATLASGPWDDLDTEDPNLGRRSNLPVIRVLSITFIEFVRAVPLITVLFMSSVMLPLFLPVGVNFDKLLRALIGVALFSAAYHIMALAAPEADRTLGGRPLSIVQAQGHGLRDAAARSNVETLQKNVALTQKFYESLNTKENVYIRLSLDTIGLKCEALEGHHSDTLDELRRSMKSTQKAGG